MEKFVKIGEIRKNGEIRNVNRWKLLNVHSPNRLAKKRIQREITYIGHQSC